MALRTILPLPGTRTPAHNLLESADHVYRGGDVWENGAQVKSEACITPTSFVVSCPPPTKSLPQDCAALVNFNPLGLEVSLVRSRVGHDVDDLRKLAEQQLDISTSSLLEAAFWANPGFTWTAAATTTDPVAAIGAIEARFLGLTSPNHAGQTGTIYMGSQPAIILSDRLEERDGNFYTKSAGSLVIVGNFPGNFIRGHLGGVDVYLSEIFSYRAEADDYVKNEYVVQAERLGLVIFEPCALWSAATGITALT